MQARSGRETEEEGVRLRRRDEDEEEKKKRRGGKKTIEAGERTVGVRYGTVRYGNDGDGEAEPRVS